MHYDLTDLRVLLAVIDERSVSRGAERCNLAPSSVSSRIRELEEQFGVALLERLPRGVQATPAGLVVAEHARRCVAQLEQMHADVYPFSHGMTSRVTVFANNNAIASFLPADLARYFAANPSVRITLEERNSNNIVAAVAEGRADVGIVALDADPAQLEFFAYRRDELVLLVPLGHPLAARGAARFSECLAHPFISLLQGAVIHTWLLNHAHSIGGRLDVRVQVSNYSAIASLVASGAGIGIVPRSALGAGDAGKVATLTLREDWAQRNLRICVRRDAPANVHRDELVATLRRGAPSPA